MEKRPVYETSLAEWNASRARDYERRGYSHERIAEMIRGLCWIKPTVSVKETEPCKS